jgi:hypothetical protein
MPATPPPPTERDETAGTAEERFHYSRVTHIAGCTVRVRIRRDVRRDHSFAIAEVLSDGEAWTYLGEDDPDTWWHRTAPPSPNYYTPATLGWVADRVLYRATKALTPAATNHTVSDYVLDGVHALLAAATNQFHGEQRFDVDDIARATTQGGALHIIEHDDGSVTFTTQHRDDCVFITSAGLHDCPDDGCLIKTSSVERW